MITYINPAIAVAGGVWLLGERLTPAMVAAFALILTGSVLATRSGRRRAAGETATAGAARDSAAPDSAAAAPDQATAGRPEPGLPSPASPA